MIVAVRMCHRKEHNRIQDICGDATVDMNDGREGVPEETLGYDHELVGWKGHT